MSAAKLRAKPPAGPSAAVAVVPKVQEDLQAVVTLNLIDLLVKLPAVIFANLAVVADQRVDNRIVAGQRGDCHVGIAGNALAPSQSALCRAGFWREGASHEPAPQLANISKEAQFEEKGEGASI